MERSNDIVSSEALLQQLGWMRGLARALLGEGHAADADDVVQEAATAALVRASGAAAPDSWRGWLAGTVRRLAWRRRRDDERRLRRERNAARPEAIESAGSAAERLSRHRRVVEALEALEPLLRDALVLRFYDGLPPRVIAERLGVPVETAKTRIKRGLERLRARLIKESGGALDGDARLRGLLLPLAGGAPGVAAVMAGGALWMTGKAKAVAAALVLAAGMGAWQLVSGDAGASHAEMEENGAAVHAAATAPMSDEGADAAPLAVVAERHDAGAPRFEPPALQPTAQLRGRVVDARGGIGAGARVRVERQDGALDAIGLDSERSRVVTLVADVVADARGAFTIAVAPNRPHALHAELGDEIALVQPCFGDEEHEVVLVPAATLRVRVVAQENGAPVEGATVWCLPLQRWREGEARSLTAADGVATFARMLPEEVRLSADTQTHRTESDQMIDVDLVAGMTTLHEIVVAEAATLIGRIVDSESGAAIPGAEVCEGRFTTRTVRSDADGHFRLPGFGSQQIAIRARGYGLKKWYGIRPQRDEGERTFALDAARCARGRVVDAEGRPLDGVHVVALASEYRRAGLGQGQQVDFVAADSNDDGRFELVDLSPSMEHTLQLSRPGFARRTLLFPSHEFDSLVVELGAIELRAPALVSGRVVDPSGPSLRGRSILLSGIDGEWTAWQPRRSGRLPSAMTSYVVQQWSALDSKGRFHFDDLAPGRYSLRVGDSLSESLEPADEFAGTLSVELGAGERRVDLVLELGPRVALAGTVVSEDGEPIDETTLEIGMAGVRRTSFMTKRVSDGAFRIEALAPGSYELRFESWDLPDKPGEPAWLPLELDDVVAGTVDLRVVLQSGRWLQGVVRDPSGAPLSRVAVAARSRGELFGPVASDEQGKFAFVVPRDASVDVEVRGPANHLAIENFAALFDRPEPPVLLRRAIAPDDGALELVVPAPR